MPISSNFHSYAVKINDYIKSIHKDMLIDICTDNSVPKRILECEKLKYNHIIVVGKKEMDNNTVNLRVHDGGKCEISIDDYLEIINKEQLMM